MDASPFELARAFASLLLSLSGPVVWGGRQQSCHKVLNSDESQWKGNGCSPPRPAVVIPFLFFSSALSAVIMITNLRSQATPHWAVIIGTGVATRRSLNADGSSTTVNRLDKA